MVVAPPHIWLCCVVGLPIIECFVLFVIIQFKKLISPQSLRLTVRGPKFLQQSTQYQYMIYIILFMTEPPISESILSDCENTLRNTHLYISLYLRLIRVHCTQEGNDIYD